MGTSRVVEPAAPLLFSSSLFIYLTRDWFERWQVGPHAKDTQGRKKHRHWTRRVREMSMRSKGRRHSIIWGVSTLKSDRVIPTGTGVIFDGRVSLIS